MPTSEAELLSALRAAGREHLSASTVARRQETGSHLFRIANYTEVKATVANREHVESSTFTVGGHEWRIDCYPNSCVKPHNGCISLFLRRTSSGAAHFLRRSAGSGAKADVAMASIKFSLLDRDGSPARTQSAPQRQFEKERYLKDDCLMVLCDVTVDLGLRTDSCTEVAAAPEPTGEWPPPPFELDGELTTAIWKKQRADVRIEVGGETLAAHRWMLEARSPVFKEDLSLAFTAGKKTAELRIDDMDAEVARALIRFIYTDALAADVRQQLDAAAAMAERLLVAAHRYRVEKLKLICEEALCRHIGMSSVAATLALAERHRCPTLKKACMQFISSPANLVAVVATDGFEQLKIGCPPDLVDLMAKHLAKVGAVDQSTFGPFTTF
ncbi:BTB/POZ and MATH domain-containing protein 1-like [Triticum dicoccoides]|uniref:BTB/POZ and MATH domain-containing protein 1-like n=1 Tax=Triticum dicoccoides TaxID=85692 RepID=UPI0018903DDC|nr:BTB/POZ and MATH domain-containing protein 1-like [Triticum dicoccoides]